MKSLGKNLFSDFIKGIEAGICVSLGGTVFLMTDNKIIGALFFTVGLFAICTMGLRLYTGRVCYVFENDGRYALSLLPIWLGNLCGTVLMAKAESFTRIGETLAQKAAVLCQTKLDDSLLSIFLLAMGCDILIFIAVDGFANNPHEFGKYLALFFGVCVFILCSFEHCVANMYYFTVASVWSGRTVLYLLVMTLGNSAGGVLLPLLRKAAG